MPPKNSSAARRPAAPRKKSGAIEIVVRRGALRRFDALKMKAGKLPVVLTWDRRTEDRRESTPAADVKRDRRHTERRRTPPFTWELADFVVVEPTKRQKSAAESATSAAASKRKKASKK